MPDTTVLRVAPSYFPYVTGPANQARTISSMLAGYGIRSRIVTTNLGASDAPRGEVLDGIEVTRLPITTGIMQYHVTAGAWRAMQETQPDIVHVHSYRSFLADVGALTARRRRVPLILHLHGSLAGYQHMVSGYHRYLYRLYDTVTSPLPTLRADRYIVSTAQEAAEVDRYGLDMRRVHIVPMAADIREYQFPDVRRDRQQILFVGRLSPDRNVEMVFRALAHIGDLPWTCRVVGGEERRSYVSQHGYLARLKDLAVQLGIANRVTFVGPLYGEDLRRAYATAGIFAYTSRWENFGQTVLEAAAAGAAPVTTPVGVANDLIVPGHSGHLVPHGSEAGLAAALRLLLARADLQEAMGNAVQQRVARHYSYTAVRDKYLSLYEELLPSRQPLFTKPGNRAS